MVPGDLLLEVNGVDVRWAPHEQVVSAIRRHVTALDLIVQSCRPQLLPVLKRERVVTCEVDGSRSEVKAIPVAVGYPPVRQQQPISQQQSAAGGDRVLAVRDAQIAPVKESPRSRHQRPEARSTGAAAGHNHHKRGVKGTKRGHQRDRDAKRANERPINGFKGNSITNESRSAPQIQANQLK